MRGGGGQYGGGSSSPLGHQMYSQCVDRSSLLMGVWIVDGERRGEVVPWSREGSRREAKAEGTRVGSVMISATRIYGAMAMAS